MLEGKEKVLSDFVTYLTGNGYVPIPPYYSQNVKVSYNKLKEQFIVFVEAQHAHMAQIKEQKETLAKLTNAYGLIYDDFIYIAQHKWIDGQIRNFVGFLFVHFKENI
jgi:hypothetical protein